MVLKCVKILSRFLCWNNLGLRVRPMSCNDLRALLLLLKGLILFVDREWANCHREKKGDYRKQPLYKLTNNLCFPTSFQT